MNLDQNIPGSLYFTWHEALYLPRWNCCHIPSQVEQDNIIRMAKAMDRIREFIGYPINVHCWIRPILNNPDSIHSGEDYNKLIGGAEHSAHKVGLAVDWSCARNCDEIRAKLLSQLENFVIRLEDKPGADWLHTDGFPPNPHRFFKP